MDDDKNYECLKFTINVVNRRCGLGLKNCNGKVVVSKLMEDSASADKLKVGDILLSINGETFKNKAECRRLILKTNKVFDIEIKRKKEVQTGTPLHVPMDLLNLIDTSSLSFTAVELDQLQDDQSPKQQVPPEVEQKEVELKPNWDNLPSDIQNILKNRLHQFEMEMEQKAESPETAQPVPNSENKLPVHSGVLVILITRCHDVPRWRKKASILWFYFDFFSWLKLNYNYYFIFHNL
ncbi:PDZ domain-containing protein [Trichinella spiralis]|uniref:PDZ domain-containing protein n=1 Tax=Trichinella spiralis TaxID=6334 RepID=A0ABR3K5M9_TRISP